MASDDDLDILAWTMLGEAGGEGSQGMTDVGHVILNRLNAGNYGGSISEVALSPKQFSTWNSGAGGNDPKGRYPKSSAEFQQARRLAQQVVAGEIAGPPGKPLDYNAPSVTPYWADSKDRHGTYTRNGHVFYPSVPVPPGEIPNVVATAMDVVPPRAPAPATLSPNLAAMRNTPKVAPVPASASKGLQAVRNGMFAQPPVNPARSMGLGDSLGMSPIQGGTQQAPLFDAAYDTTAAAMRQVLPVDTQGMGTFATAPKPATMSPQLAGRRANDPLLQAALNAKVASGNKPSVSASDLARGKSGISTIASIPTTGVGLPPATRSVPSVPMAFPKPVAPPSGAIQTAGLAGNVALPPGVRPQIPSTTPKPALSPAYNQMTPQQRLAMMAMPSPQVAALPQIPGPAGSINTNKDPVRLAPNGGPAGNAPLIAAAHGIAPAVQVAKVAPIPMPASMRPFAVATQLDTAPMPPMPIRRPGIGGPVPTAPVPTQGLAPVPFNRPGSVSLPQIIRQSPLAQFLGGVQARQVNTMPTAYVGKVKNMLGLSSADAYRFANGSNNPITLEDRITGRSSSGGGASSISSI